MKCLYHNVINIDLFGVYYNFYFMQNYGVQFPILLLHHQFFEVKVRYRIIHISFPYKEMFGKDGPLHEQISDDEDWGPVKRKRREKESDAASTLMTLYESERIPDVTPTEVKSKHPPDTQVRRACFRIPRKAVEVLEHMTLPYAFRQRYL